MKFILLIVLFFYSLYSYSQSQYQSFEEYKQNEQQEFNKFVKKYKHDIKEMQRVEDEWNFITLEDNSTDGNGNLNRTQDQKLRKEKKRRVVSNNIDKRKSKSITKLEEKRISKNINNSKREVPKLPIARERKSESDVKSATKVKIYIPYGSPLPQGRYRISSKFGTRVHPIFRVKKHHTGIDLASKISTPISVPSNGTVLRAGWARGYGNYIVVDHGGGYKTAYAHLSRLKVKKGNIVNRGDVLGFVGSTGYSTGPHLHYEVIKNGKKVDPERYLNRRSL